VADQVVQRPSVERANVAALRTAYAAMQELPATDNRSWIYWAGFHGFPDYDCWHHGRIGVGPTDPNPYDLFLPWHRAYLMYWDHVTRDQDEAAILPWWDWTSAASHEIGVPDAYATETADNPLFSGPTPDMPDDPARRTRRFPGDPGELPTPEQVDRLLGLRDFIDFSTQVQDLHDQIHGWAGGIDPANPDQGGDMGSIASAAFDPLFWAHHAMIDRLWYLWQLEHGVDNIPPDYLRQSLAPFGYTVEQVLDTRRLGYEYATSSVVSTEEDR
jgi:tyrosinase